MCLSKKLILALQTTYLCDKDMDEEEADLYLQLPNILRVHFLNGGDLMILKHSISIRNMEL